MVCDKVKETVNFQDIIKTDDLSYESKRIDNFNKYCLPIVFLRDMHKGHLSLEDADDEQVSFCC